jgi:hypothetical protein
MLANLCQLRFAGMILGHFRSASTRALMLEGDKDGKGEGKATEGSQE